MHHPSYRPVLYGMAFDQSRRRNGGFATLLILLGMLFIAASVWALDPRSAVASVCLFILGIVCFIAASSAGRAYRYQPPEPTLYVMESTWQSRNKARIRRENEAYVRHHPKR